MIIRSSSLAITPTFLTNSAAYVRVGSVAIAAYDYLRTLPVEWRFYSTGIRSRKLSSGLILFFLIRYFSITILVISNIGYFGNFTRVECERYYVAAPIFKVLQTMISQVILGLRTANISGRNLFVVRAIILLFVGIAVGEWFTNLFQRTPVQQAQNCTPGNGPSHLSVWLYYVLAMLYDIITLAISTFYLLRASSGANRMSSLIRMMFYDGLGYFVVLTASNIFNLVLYRTSDETVQSSGASLGYTVTWVMSQQILINLRDAAEAHRRAEVFTRPLTTAHEVSQAMRSQFTDNSASKDSCFTHSGRGSGSRPSRETSDTGARESIALDVQIDVEQRVTVEYSSFQEPESRHSPRVRWKPLPRG